MKTLEQLKELTSKCLVCMCFYLLSVMAYFYVVIIIHCHRIGYKRE